MSLFVLDFCNLFRKFARLSIIFVYDSLMIKEIRSELRKIFAAQQIENGPWVLDSEIRD